MNRDPPNSVIKCTSAQIQGENPWGQTKNNFLERTVTEEVSEGQEFLDFLPPSLGIQ